MTGQQAKEYGLVDEVLTPAAVAQVPAMIGNGSSDK
jgi:ATP-dependent protease ClpP protease subunit